MDRLIDIAGYLLFPIYYVLQPTSQYYVLTYVGAAITAIVLYVVLNQRTRISTVGAVQLVLPRRLVRHASTWLDFKLFFVSSQYDEF